ncbi:MAG: TonB-dependent receptor [Bacteroidaceae bacterium]|nr:TonB-dependent receptor [Bacteroidaceae bacterium]
MKQPRFFFVMTCMTVSSMAMAQSTTVKGVLMNETLGESEPFATVRVYNEGKTEKPVAMFVTDMNGQFSQEVKGRGRFDILFTSVGKEDLKKTITLTDGGVLDLDTLYIKDSSTALSGAEVVAQKPLVKMEVDKMTYNVEEDVDSKASSVLDMLRKVPMVTVDGQDNITVNGSSSFKVYVDGKPSVLFSSNPSMVFKSMPATAVKNIEVITNPGAKYDTEGVGGVLNIVMNRQNPQAMQSLNGYNGTLRASAGNRSLGGSAFVSGQQGKLSFSVNATENYMTPGTTTVDAEQTQAGGNIATHAETTLKMPFTMGNLNLGYELDSMSSLGLSVSLTSFSMKNNGLNTAQMSGNSYGTAFGYGNTFHQKTSKTSLSGSLDYQHFFNTERTRSFSLIYQLNYDPTTNKMRSDFDQASTSFIDLTDRYTDGTDHTTNHTLQADFTTPLGKGQTLNLGVKGMMHRATSDSKYYLEDVLNEQMSMDYRYKNSILAGYAEYDGKWKKLGAKGGLRYEHTWQDVEYRQGNGSDFSTHYGSLVPSASLSYTLSPSSNIGLTYNMRISRPGISYLNPYVNHSDPTSLSYGNTDLDVEKSHNLSLVYNLFTPKLMLNANLHHNFTNNAIEQYSFYEGQLLNTTYGNIVKRRQTGLNIYANWLMAKNTRLFLNGSVNYTDLSSNILATSNSGWQTSGMVGAQQTLPWDLKLGAYLITSSKSYTLQGWSSGFNLCTANISKSLLNDRLNLSLSGMLGLTKGGNLEMKSYSRGNGFDTHQTIKVPMSGFTFSVSYSFGNTTRQAKQRPNRIQSDYIEQQTQGELLQGAGNVKN